MLVVNDSEVQSMDDSFDLLGLNRSTTPLPTPHSDNMPFMPSSPSRDLGFGYKMGSTSGGSPRNEYPVSSPQSPAFAASRSPTSVFHNPSSQPAVVDLLSLGDDLMNRDFNAYKTNTTRNINSSSINHYDNNTSTCSYSSGSVDNLLDVDVVDVSSVRVTSSVNSSRKCDAVLKLFEQPPDASSSKSPRPPSATGPLPGGLYFNASNMSPPNTPNTRLEINNNSMNAYNIVNNNLQNSSNRLILSTPIRQNQPPPIPPRPNFPAPTTLPDGIMNTNMNNMDAINRGRAIPPMKPPKNLNMYTAK